MNDKEYKRRIRAWTMYDWANSAFATTIMAAVLPVYYSQVAGSTLPSASVATAYWSAGLSISLFVVAILAPILGTISDVVRGKKKFLSVFMGLGIIGTGLLVLVDTGDWVLASLLFIFGRIGFTGANVFYDALLPHIAKREDLDVVSTRGYAMGYLGGGLLLAVNIVMIQILPGTWGARLSFLSVAIWWAVFSIPLFRQVPEPPSDTAKLAPGETIIGVSFKRLWETIKDIHHYRELFKYLIAFLIYIDGIGTIMGVAVIYGAELGFGSIELIAALLMVQFVGIPYSLIFGRLPSKNEKRRPFYLAFVLFNIIALPLTGIFGARLLPADVSGAPPAPFTDTATAVGEGTYIATDDNLTYTGDWSTTTISASELGTEADADYRITTKAGDRFDFPFNGQKLKITYSTGPEYGIWSLETDGQPLLDEDTGEHVTIDAYNPTIRYGVTSEIIVEQPGEYILTLVNTGEMNPESQGIAMSIAQITVLPPIRESNLLLIIGLIFAMQAIGLVLALILGKPVFSKLAETIDTRRGILIALLIYTIVAIWGYVINSVVEFWLLAWMVAVVQGGSQALSRSLFSSMAPAAKSGEFFGFFGIMEKFSAIVGPLIFALAATTFGSSRPAVLSIVVFFIVGGFLLTRVNIDEGRRVAQEEDALLLAPES
ncbi:MAG: MFS transporter [Chloroflexi bacterium]|nr:MFS transporter [Chloroflexota bacterium]MBU1662296.1 MFS transporter [Chloroflexota bacterium]